MLTLLSGAAELVLWSIAIVLAIAVFAILALHAWDKWSMWRFNRHRGGK